METYSNEEIKYIFDKLISFSENAIQDKEVPITACFATKKPNLISFFEQNKNCEIRSEIILVKGSKTLLIEKNHNLTNKTGNATKHCEILAINSIQEFNSSNEFKINFEELDCFVTVEPCIMCGYALKLANINKTYFILANSKFGGIVSLIQIENFNFLRVDYREEDIINSLKFFYEEGNEKLDLENRHRQPKLKKIKENN